MARMRVLLAGTGSWGDVSPFVPIAQALTKRGHAVRVATQPNYVHYLRRQGIATIRTGPGYTRPVLDKFHQEIANLSNRGFAALRHYWTKMVLPTTRPAYVHLVNSLADFRPDIVVGHYHSIAAAAYAARFDLPFVRYVCAGLGPVPTDQHPPPDDFYGRRDLRRALEPGLDHGGAWTRTLDWCADELDDLTADACDAVSIPALPGAPFEWNSPVMLTLVASTPRVLPSGYRIPSGLLPVGFPSLEDRSECPPAVESFLKAGEPPIGVTFGTAIAPGVRQTCLRVVEALLERGRRVICLGAPIPERERALSVSYVPLSAIAGRLDGIVHHAGPGTMFTAIKAGIPSVALPHFFDQPFNAAVLHSLALGRSVAPARLATEALEDALEMFADVDSPERANTMELAARLRDDQPPDERVADALEAIE